MDKLKELEITQKEKDALIEVIACSYIANKDFINDKFINNNEMKREYKAKNRALKNAFKKLFNLDITQF